MPRGSINFYRPAPFLPTAPAAPSYSIVNASVWSGSSTTGYTGPLTVVPNALGDAMVLGAINQGGTSVSAVTGGGCTNWRRVAGPFTYNESTASIIEMARSAVADRARFPRTLVFVAFAGEERGLLGSAYYASHAAVPIESTIAMLNLDMVGRARGNVDVSGLEYAPSMEEDLRAAAQGLRGLSIKREGPGAGRSDDSNFQSRRIPAINFFTGFHGDYHRPGDDWEKIDTQGTSQIATLAFELAARLAARPTRPEFVQR